MSLTERNSAMEKCRMSLLGSEYTVETLIMHKVIMQNSHNAKLLALTELVPI